MAVRKTAKGAALKRWFKEDWKDVSTGKACGRKKGDGRSTPYCRPSKRVSSKTPKTSGEMTAAQKKSRIAQKKSLGQPAGKPRRVASLTRRNTVKKMKEGGMLKAVPQDKKKSLGKLPTPVREKMGFMREGGPTSRAQIQRAPTSRAQGQNPKRLSKEERLKRRTEARRALNKKNTMPKREVISPHSQKPAKGSTLYGDGKDYRKFKKGMSSAKPTKGMSSAKPTKDLSKMSLSDVFRGAANDLTKSNKGTSTPSVARDRYNDIKKKRGLKEGGMVIVDRQYLKGK